MLSLRRKPDATTSSGRIPSSGSRARSVAGEALAQIAHDLGISESCLRSWVHEADVDEGGREGLSSTEREELVTLRRELRATKMADEILKRAAAYSFRRTSSQNHLLLHRSDQPASNEGSPRGIGSFVRHPPLSRSQRSIY
jgi:transposase-like protein